jgi:ABC-type nitrate/sulfonate/bicarbonate transport system substrate-binding protein
VNLIPARLFFDFFSLGVITSEKMLSERSDLVHRFVGVTLTSLRYALRNKDEALAAFAKASSNFDDAYESAKFDSFKELLTDKDSEETSIGGQSLEEWNASLKTLYDIGLIKSPLRAQGRFIPLPQ